MNLSPTVVARDVVRALRRATLRIQRRGGQQKFGKEFIVGPRPRLAPGLTIEVGNRVNIGADTTINTNLRVGDDVMISSSVAFIGNDHDFSDPALSIQDQARRPVSSVVVEGDNLIGFGTIILGNVTIGRGAIVGAGSLVLRDIPADSVCVGRPAVPIGRRR